MVVIKVSAHPDIILFSV